MSSRKRTEQSKADRAYFLLAYLLAYSALALTLFGVVRGLMKLLAWL